MLYKMQNACSDIEHAFFFLQVIDKVINVCAYIDQNTANLLYAYLTESAYDKLVICIYIFHKDKFDPAHCKIF